MHRSIKEMQMTNGESQNGIAQTCDLQETKRLKR